MATELEFSADQKLAFQKQRAMETLKSRLDNAEQIDQAQIIGLQIRLLRIFNINGLTQKFEFPSDNLRNDVLSGSLNRQYRRNILNLLKEIESDTDDFRITEAITNLTNIHATVPQGALNSSTHFPKFNTRDAPDRLGHDEVES